MNEFNVLTFGLINGATIYLLEMQLVHFNPKAWANTKYFDRRDS